MLSIKFLDKNKKSLTVINTYTDMSFSNKLADTCTASISIPYTQETITKLTKDVLALGNFVEIWMSINEGRRVYTGVIRTTKKKGQGVSIDCVDPVSYYRIFVNKEKDRTGYSQSRKVSDFLVYLHGQYLITEFTIGVNTDDRIITVNLNEQKTFYDVMMYLKQYHDVFWRVDGYVMDVFGIYTEVKPGLWKYDYDDLMGSNVIDFERVQSLDGIFINGQEDNYPSIEVDEKERYKYKIGNKKAIQIRTQLEDGSMGYVGLITEISTRVLATQISTTIKVDEKTRKRVDTDLRYVLENLHNRVIS